MFRQIEKDADSLVKVSHNKYLMGDKKIAFFGDTNKVMLLDLKKQDWVIKTINNNYNNNGGSGSNGNQSSPNQRASQPN